MAWLFTGSTDRLNFGSGVTELTGNWTIAGWVRRTIVGRDFEITPIWSRWTSDAGNRQLYVYFLSDTSGVNVDKVQVDVPFVAAILTGGTAISDTNWHHYAVTRSGNDWVLYIDGVSDGTATVAATQETGAELTFGDTIVTATGAGDMAGDQAEWSAWDAALTAAEVASLAKRSQAIQVRPTSLVFYAPMMGRQNPDIDIVGGNLGSIQGMANAVHPPMSYAGSRQAIQTKSGHRFNAAWAQRANRLIGHLYS